MSFVRQQEDTNQRQSVRIEELSRMVEKQSVTNEEQSVMIEQQSMIIEKQAVLVQELSKENGVSLTSLLTSY